MTRISKKRNWHAIRLDLTPGEDGWSEISTWHIAHIDDPDVVITGTGADSLITKIVMAPAGHWVCTNLNIDGRLIIAHLLSQGWTSTNNDTPLTHQFEPLISEDGKIIRIRVRGKNGLQDIGDMKRLVPVSLDDLKSIVCNGDTDWRISDPVNIAARMLHHLNTEDLTRFTLSSNAYNNFLDTITRERFARIFPPLKKRESLTIQQAFTGGIVYLNPTWRGKLTGPGISVDANSLYPSQAISQRLPVGKPKRYEGEPDLTNGMLTVITAVVDWQIKPGGLPILARRWTRFEDNHHASISPTEITMTDIDWQLFQDNYDITVTAWRGGYQFYGMHHIFDNYMQHWGDIKQHSQGAQRLMAKLMLNALLGKFGSRIVRASRIPVMDQQGHVTYEIQDPKTTRGIYMPIAAWVNAYARQELVTRMQANRDRIIYADTDSMHLIGTEEPNNVPIDPAKFGYWKIDKRFSQSKHLREKSYLWTDISTGDLECRSSGMPGNIARIMNYEIFHDGWTNYGPNGITPGLERWLPIVDAERVKMIGGRYRIGG